MPPVQCNGKEPTCQRAGGSIPGWGKSPGVGNGKPLQYSCLENSVDRGAWRATVHEVAELDTTSTHEQTAPVSRGHCGDSLPWCIWSCTAPQSEQIYKINLCRVLAVAVAHRIFLVSCGSFHCGAHLSNCDVRVQYALGHWGSSWIRDQTHFLCIARQIFFPSPSEREKRFLFDKLCSEIQRCQALATQLRMRGALSSPAGWGCQPCPSASSRTMQRSFGRRHFGPVHASGLLLRRESEFLSAERKNGIHKHTDTHGSEQGLLKRRKVQRSQHRHGEGVKSPPQGRFLTTGPRGSLVDSHFMI